MAELGIITMLSGKRGYLEYRSSQKLSSEAEQKFFEAVDQLKEIETTTAGKDALSYSVGKGFSLAFAKTVSAERLERRLAKQAAYRAEIISKMHQFGWESGFKASMDPVTFEVTEEFDEDRLYKDGEVCYVTSQARNEDFEAFVQGGGKESEFNYVWLTDVIDRDFESNEEMQDLKTKYLEESFIGPTQWAKWEAVLQVAGYESEEKVFDLTCKEFNVLKRRYRFVYDDIRFRLEKDTINPKEHVEDRSEEAESFRKSVEAMSEEEWRLYNISKALLKLENRGSSVYFSLDEVAEFNHWTTVGDSADESHFFWLEMPHLVEWARRLQCDRSRKIWDLPLAQELLRSGIEKSRDLDPMFLTGYAPNKMPYLKKDVMGRCIKENGKFVFDTDAIDGVWDAAQAQIDEFYASLQANKLVEKTITE